jgi:tetratricopeptide (TPR) repeat protein
MTVLRSLSVCGYIVLGSLASRAEDRAQSLYIVGGQQFDARNFNGALSNFQASAGLAPSHPETYNMIGRTKWWLHDYAGAIKAYDTAIRLYPECGGFYCNRGQAKENLHQTSEALADYDMAIRLDPKNTQAFYNRGTVNLLCLTNAAAALSDFDRAIALDNDPNEEDLYQWRGNARMALGDYPGAVADYRKALRVGTNANWRGASDTRTNIVIAERLLLEAKKK